MKIKLFEEYKTYNNLYEYNIRIIKKYIKALEIDTDKYNFTILFFIILHNELIFENIHKDEFIINNIEINKYLDLKDTNKVDEIYKIFTMLYDPECVIRNNIENINKSKSFVNWLSKSGELENFYKKLLNRNQIILTIDANKYNL